jgi:hypothetical protein
MCQILASEHAMVHKGVAWFHQLTPCTAMVCFVHRTIARLLRIKSCRLDVAVTLLIGFALS